MARPQLPIRPTVSKPKKNFTIESWDGDKSGEKILLYAETGMGKTTLSATSQNPVFIGLDEGGRKIKNPITGKELNRIPNRDAAGNDIPFTFGDVRSALNAALTLDCQTVVIDTGTILEYLAERWVLTNVKGPKNSIAVNIESYGYNKGYKHLYDAMRKPLFDCDKLIAVGKNVIIVCQSTNNRIANPGGEDYLCNGPRLYNGKPSILSLYSEWADHILRIDYEKFKVDEKKAVGETTRIISTKPEIYFMAKSRTIVEPLITFSEPADDSIWKFMFGGK